MRNMPHGAKALSPTTALNAHETAQRLPYRALSLEIRRVLADPSIQVPSRLVQPLDGGARLFVMPAADSDTAIAKLITWTPSNAGTALPAIQGDVVVFDVATGQRRLILDGPTVTARRTAAVSLVAAQCLASRRDQTMLLVGAGVQGRAHLEAFVEEFSVRDVVIASGHPASAEALVDYARSLGVRARSAGNPQAELPHCDLVVTCTPASAIVLDGPVQDPIFIAAVGAFTPQMRELGATLCRYIARQGTVVVDTADACHEAGDLLQADLDVTSIPCLRDALERNPPGPNGPVLFKSCGWAGWDLAAARVAMAQSG